MKIKEISKTICVSKIDRYIEEIFDARIEKKEKKNEKRRRGRKKKREEKKETEKAKELYLRDPYAEHLRRSPDSSDSPT